MMIMIITIKNNDYEEDDDDDNDEDDNDITNNNDDNSDSNGQKTKQSETKHNVCTWTMILIDVEILSWVKSQFYSTWNWPK